MDLLIHPRTLHQVERLIARPGGSVMLYGADGVGKQTIAKEIARQINCQGCSDRSCHSCRMADAGHHPDIVLVTPDEKGKIGIDAVHQLQHDLQFRQYEPDSQRVVIIANINTMTIPAQNALLKTLEEPPTSTTMIVTAISPVSVLETITSRCRPLYVSPVSTTEIEGFLRSRSDIERSTITDAANMSNGLVGRAFSFASSAEELERQRIIEERTNRLSSTTNLFERLVAAGEIAQKVDELPRYLEAITSWGRQAARQGSGAANNLLAIERLRARIGANVSPKVALEAFAVEVVC